MVYKKGAWVLHMLRILTLDLKTMNEDRFTGIMREFYQSYQGQRASTDDFRRVVERHIGADMGGSSTSGWTAPRSRPTGWPRPTRRPMAASSG